MMGQETATICHEMSSGEPAVQLVRAGASWQGHADYLREGSIPGPPL